MKIEFNINNYVEFEHSSLGLETFCKNATIVLSIE